MALGSPVAGPTRMTLAECRPGRKVRITGIWQNDPAGTGGDWSDAEGWILYANPAPLQQTYWQAPDGDRTTPRVPVLVQREQRVTVQYWSPLRCAWLTEQFRPEQLAPAPELATDDVPGRPA